MSKKFAVAISLNGETILLSTHNSPSEAAEALHTSRIRWVDAFVVAR